MTATSKEDGNSKIASLTDETKEILHQSILNYLHRSGFSKTLKRFQSEAQIQNEAWKDSSANLEEIYCKYVNGSRNNEDDNGDTKKDVKDEKTTTSKKKNKKNSDVEDQFKSIMSNVEPPQDNVVVEAEIKSKKKKKTKETKSDEPKKPEEDAMNESEVNESKKKTKDKKRKSNQEDKPATNGTENGDVDVSKEEKKSSKKRKRLLSDENENKTEASKEDEDAEIDANGNEKSEINEEKSQKSVKKQRIGSVEPKTINAFQRVKIDQVEFAHEKLQDNSYWAKDGADIGYGAKAQEVLGLVRGKGFRHEKTKKKRGSYRGGQIDLQSHSIKFDYSDQE